jgi:hypothetical protein
MDESINIEFKEYSNQEFAELIPHMEHSIKSKLKYFLYDDEFKWIVYKQDLEIVSVACVRYGDFGDIEIKFLFSFKKGCGKEMLSHILEKYKASIFWLECDGTGGEKLLNYYRNLGFSFTEYINENGKHFFYKNINLNKKNLFRFIEEMF